MTARGLQPTNEYRPICSPPSTDSNKNDSPAPRILRYAESGVSRSARIRRVTGIKFPCAAYFKNSSSVGEYMASLLPHTEEKQKQEGVDSVLSLAEGVLK